MGAEAGEADRHPAVDDDAGGTPDRHGHPERDQEAGRGRMLAENVPDGRAQGDQDPVTNSPRISVARAAAMTVFRWARTLT